MLGGLRLLQGERVITRFRTYKTGVLLAYLAFYRHRAHPREQLMELLWPDGELNAVRNSLSQSLSSLRHQLEPPGVPTGAVLRADRSGVQLNPEAITTDVAAFEAALQAAHKKDTGTTTFLADAVECYGGELLPGYYEDWNLSERRRLLEDYLAALRRLIDLSVEERDWARALDYARRAVAADPLREETHERLIRLYAVAGNPTAALRQFEEMERRFEKDLGVTPDPALQAFVTNLKSLSGPPAPISVTEPVPAALPVSSALPTGTVTFLLIEEETGRDDAFAGIVARHGGIVAPQIGETRTAAFGRASDALACAVAAQRVGRAAEEPARMALHTGEVKDEMPAVEGEVSTLSVSVREHGTRLLLAASWGQILCSEETAGLLRRDLEPGTRLVDLGLFRLQGPGGAERLFAVDYLGLASQEIPRPKAEPVLVDSLPLQFTRFFGRSTELALLESLLLPAPESETPVERSAVRPRLITLLGPGGTGKTRLALEAARALLEPFAGAVWFVPLAEISDPALVPEAVVKALRLPYSAGVDPLDQAVEALSRHPTLLILDNFEQLVAGAEREERSGGQIVQTLLERVPSLVCLITSRQRLGLRGERIFTVAPLPVPRGPETPDQLTQIESVRLFVDRAQAVKPDFQVTPGNAAAVAALCERLEGIPLGLELAAARAQVLTPAQMLTQLERRFDFLVSRRRDTALRHRTLRAAVDWSYQLLAPELQAFFASLSVFQGGWTLEAVEEICQEPLSLDYLEQLRECSLVVAEESGEGSTAEMRYRLLETLREYAQERLAPDAQAALRRRHTAFFLAVAEQAEAAMTGPEQGLWLSRLEREHDNLRAALQETFRIQELDLHLRLCGALWSFWEIRGHISEGRQHLSRALELTEATGHTKARTKALLGAGSLAWRQGDYAAAQALHQRSVESGRELGDPHLLAAALYNLGLVAHDQSHYARARSLYEESLAIRREMGDRHGIARSLNSIGIVAREQGDYAAARAVQEECLAIFREFGDRRGIANLLNSLGIIAREQGDYAQARDLTEQGLALRRELGDKRGIALSLSSLGNIAREEEDYAAASALHEESLTLFRSLGDRWCISLALDNLGMIARDQEDMTRARAFHEESLAILRELGDRGSMAGTLCNLAVVVRLQGRYAEADALRAESLALFREFEDRSGVARGLLETARAALAQEQSQRAAVLFGASEALREAMATFLSPKDEYGRAAAALRSDLGEEAFAAAWEQGRSLSWEQAVDYALT